nr:tetratricopeptide repeat protein [uncultured Desulfobacter sp.]
MIRLDSSKAKLRAKGAGTADQLVEQGLKYYEKGDFPSAGRYYKQAIHLDPGNASAFLYLGVLANEANQPGLAVSMLEQAISLSPDLAPAYENLGMALNKLGRNEEAAKNFERAQSLDPDAGAQTSKVLEKKSTPLKTKTTANPPPKAPETDHPPNDQLQNVIQLYQTGNMAGTEQRCREMLKKFPDSYMLLNILGAAVQAQGRIEEAIQAFDRMLLLNPDFSEGYYNRGVAFSETGQRQAAVEDYSRAVGLNPDFYNAHLNLGLTLDRLGRCDEAIHSFDQAIALEPDNSHGYNNRAFSLMNASRLDAALKDCETAIAIDPNLPEIHNIRGLIYDKLGKHQRAVNCFKQALQLKPGAVQFQVNLAKSLNELEKYEQALTHCNQAVDTHPNSPDAFYNRGIALQGLMRLEQAIESYDRAIELSPKSSDAFCNRGICFHRLGQIDKGFADFNEAIKLTPDNVRAYSNRGISHRRFGQFDLAENDFEQALSIDPDHGLTLFNRAVLYLLRGDFERGWKEYEWRWTKSAKRIFRYGKVWEGEPLSGKRIFIYGEQGLGDFIQFVRYLPQLQKMGARVILECSKTLGRLMIHFKGYDRLEIKIDDNAPQFENSFDYHLPIMSLPMMFQSTLDTIPANVPYLFSDKDLKRIWQSKMDTGNALDVGVVWAGNPSHKGDRRRSLSLSRFSPLKEIKGIHLYSLQKDAHELWTDQDPDNFFTLNFGPQLSDFADTAAIISNLDLIISVDTSVAHLAGALGKETWILLPFSPDWRWLTQREDSPWYPTVRLFRQPAPGDWDNVFETVTEALKQKIDQTK